MKPTPNDDVIRNLNFLCKTYDSVVRTCSGTKNRLQALNPDMAPKNNDIIKSMESTHGKIARQIEKELEFWPIYTAWMKDVPGIGPYTAGNLILLYYYRFIPVCKNEGCGGDLTKIKDGESEEGKGYICSKCGKKAKGDGVLAHRVDKTKDFPNVSKWWHYMGEHVVDGKKPKMQKGITVDWSPKGRAISYTIGDSFEGQRNSAPHPYKEYYLQQKEKLRAIYPDKTLGHTRSMARMKTSKLFLSHFWHVARELEGKSTRGVYADVILNHSGIVAPFYYEPHVN